MKDALLGALIGLARALCENEHLRTGETDGLLRAGVVADDTEAAALLPLVRAEKCRIVPDCAACGFSCDKNADYDLSALAGAEPALRERKQALLAALPALAADPAPQAAERIALALRAIGDFWTPETLDRALRQVAGEPLNR